MTRLRFAPRRRLTAGLGPEPRWAPRRPLRLWRHLARGAWRRLRLLLAGLALAAPAAAQEAPVIRDVPAQCVGAITGARYDGPTTRYAHGVLGDAVEWGRLVVAVRNRPGGPFPGSGAGSCRWGAAKIGVDLPRTLVFEDTAPRLADLDGDGLAEIITVESSLTRGARLSVWGMTAEGFARRAATPFIGQAHRWLAPLGAADLDGDGAMELAYIDRPHLARTLRVWRYAGGRLTQVAALKGLTNHRIGEDFISGGIRDCGKGPEIVAADAGWRRLVAVRLADGTLSARDIGAFVGPASFAAALRCD